MYQSVLKMDSSGSMRRAPGDAPAFFTKNENEGNSEATQEKGAGRNMEGSEAKRSIKGKARRWTEVEIQGRATKEEGGKFLEHPHGTGGKRREKMLSGFEK